MPSSRCSTRHRRRNDFALLALCGGRRENAGMTGPRLAAALLIVAALVLLGGYGVYLCRPTGPDGPGPDNLAGPPFFEDVTTAAGIDATYRNGQDAGHFAILESLGGGV